MCEANASESPLPPVILTTVAMFRCLPSVVPSSPVMIFIEVMICWATGGEMEVAYRALWEWQRR